MHPIDVLPAGRWRSESYPLLLLLRLRGRREECWWGPSRNPRRTLPHWRRVFEYTRLIVACEDRVGGKAKALDFVVQLAVGRFHIVMMKELMFALGLGPVYVIVRNLLKSNKASALPDKPWTS